jgi:hypothetical protein
MLNQLLWYIYLILLIAAVGPSITYAVWIQRATANRDALPFTLQSIKIINDRMVLPATALALITWVVMVYVSGQSLLIPWVVLTSIFWLAALVIGLLGYSPAIRKQVEFAESEGVDSDEYKSTAWRAMILGIVIGIIFLLLLLLMAFQPALWG